MGKSKIFLIILAIILIVCFGVYYQICLRTPFMKDVRHVFLVFEQAAKIEVADEDDKRLLINLFNIRFTKNETINSGPSPVHEVEVIFETDTQAYYYTIVLGLYGHAPELRYFGFGGHGYLNYSEEWWSELLLFLSKFDETHAASRL